MIDSCHQHFKWGIGHWRRLVESVAFNENVNLLFAHADAGQIGELHAMSKPWTRDAKMIWDGEQMKNEVSAMC